MRVPTPSVAAKAAQGGRGDYGQDPPPSVGLRHHGREQRIRQIAFSQTTRSALTGGSSSGSAASVQEGSAVAAIGTDTGGSDAGAGGALRVSRLSLFARSGRSAQIMGGWHSHLAVSFDTLGWLFRDLRDGPVHRGCSARCGTWWQRRRGVTIAARGGIFPARL